MSRLVACVVNWSLIGLVVCTPAAVEAQVPAERIRQAADSLLISLHQRGLFNGAVVLGRSEEEIYARGFGTANFQAGALFTPDTPTDGASISKTFTAVAIFMLEDEGRLRLGDAVQRYIPEYPHAGTQIRHLLTHSAGLPEAEYDFFTGLIPPERVRATSLFVEVLRQRGVPPAFPPGTKFRYSSLGFDVAALLIERVTHKTWVSFLQERVFTPLGMHTTLSGE